MYQQASSISFKAILPRGPPYMKHVHYKHKKNQTVNGYTQIY